MLTGGLISWLAVTDGGPLPATAGALLPAGVAWVARTSAHVVRSARARSGNHPVAPTPRWQAHRLALCLCSAAYLAAAAVILFRIGWPGGAATLAAGAVAYVWWSGVLDRLVHARRRAAHV